MNVCVSVLSSPLNTKRLRQQQIGNKRLSSAEIHVYIHTYTYPIVHVCTYVRLCADIQIPTTLRIIYMSGSGNAKCNNTQTNGSERNKNN